MRGNIVYPDGRNYICDACGGNMSRFKSKKEAKAAGWAISADYKYCYCPECAPYHRHVGRGGHISAKIR